MLNVPINFFFEDMDKEVASQSPRVFSTIDSEALTLEETSYDIDMDPMKKQETLELIKAHYKINNRQTARLLFDLIISMSKSPSVSRHEAKEDENND